MGSSTGYTVQTQLRYIMQWFHEWSEMQRGDFIPVLAQKFVPSGYVNGLITGVDSLSTSEDRPPSLFQCRIKLFRDWSACWSTADKDQLLSQIKSADSTFASKFEEEMKSLSAEEVKVLGSPSESVDYGDLEALRTVEPEVIEA